MLMRRANSADGAGMTIVPGAPGLVDRAAEAAEPTHAFLRWAWYAATVEESAQSLVALRPDGSALAALIRQPRRIGPFVIGEVPGCYWPFRSVPIAADASGAELAAFLGRRETRGFLGRLWRMGPVCADDPAATLLASAAEAAGWRVLRRQVGTSFDIDFAELRAQGPWPRNSTLSKNRWRERRLNAIGPVSYRSVPASAWEDADLDTVATIEANSWVAQKDGDTKFLDPARRAIWVSAAQDPAVAGLMSLSLMFVGDTPAAFTFCLEAGGTRHCIANGFDQRFAEFSPGKVLLYKDFCEAAERGIERIGWGSGDTGYKSEMGARGGTPILDLLFVRPRPLAALIRPLWRDLAD
jgi:CelD/BcsL family acetyltransferase involved in cellulose biosynthesis